mgnify:CR=1 FL=1
MSFVTRTPNLDIIDIFKAIQYMTHYRMDEPLHCLLDKDVTVAGNAKIVVSRTDNPELSVVFWYKGIESNSKEPVYALHKNWWCVRNPKQIDTDACITNHILEICG